MEPVSEINAPRNWGKLRDDSQEAHKSVLAEPPPLWSRQVFGPSAVFTALAIGSGELVFWPGLSLSNGAGVLWVGIFAVILQYVINLEIARYSLATGESIVVGASRMWKGWAWMLLLGAVIPWLWPGWARAGCQLLGTAFNAPEKMLSVISLVICGALLSAPKVVYKLLERIQALLLIFIIVGVLVVLVVSLAITPNTLPFWKALLSGVGMGTLLSAITVAQSQDYLALLGGVVFAGAGGILNLGYGLLICEKGFGMGRYAGQVVGLRHSLGLRPAESKKPEFTSDPKTLGRWHRWLMLSRKEHGLLFVGGNVFTIIFIALIFFCLLGPDADGQGMTFLSAASERLALSYGNITSMFFIAVAFAIFFTSEIGILDITSRIASGIIYYNLSPRTLSPSALYHLILWTEIAIGVVLTVSDPRQPYWFLVTSAFLNLFVMAIYSALVALLNRKQLPLPTRPSYFTTLILGGAGLLYGALFIVTILHL